MQVTEIRIIPVDRGALRAYVNITFDHSLVVNDIEIIEGPNGLFLAMPTRELSDGTTLDIFSPADAETAKQLQDVVIAEYTFVMSKTPLAY
jgi:stage V sporulation protein G